MRQIHWHILSHHNQPTNSENPSNNPKLKRFLENIEQFLLKFKLILKGRVTLMIYFLQVLPHGLGSSVWFDIEYVLRFNNPGFDLGIFSVPG